MAEIEFAARIHQMMVGLAAESLIAMISTDLTDVIGDRNKLAHGQWEWHLNNKETAFAAAAPPVLNYLQVFRRSEMINTLARLVYVLSVSEPTFQRDYDALYQNATWLRALVDGADYPDFAKSLRARRQNS